MSPISWEQGFSFWADIVHEYSHKNFTYESDILRACTGILYAFQGYSKWLVFYGMPEPLIDIALGQMSNSQAGPGLHERAEFASTWQKAGKRFANSVAASSSTQPRKTE
jgi:hypothetical protein